MKRAFLILLLSATVLSAGAQGRRSAGARGPQPTDTRKLRSGGAWSPQHELRFSVGMYPFKGGDSYWTLWRIPASGPASDRYHDATTFPGPPYATGTLSAEYSFRINNRLDLGGSATYLGVYKHLLSNRDGSTQGRLYRHYFTLMPQARFTWYRSRLVRLYSLASVGMTLVAGYKKDIRSDVLFAFQLSPIGISVGRRLFGFAEVGLGAQGAARIGIGYQFGRP